MTELYRCDLETSHYVVRKFDEDYSLLSKYNVTMETCDCPRGEHKTCRHRHTILPLFIRHKHVGDGWLLDFHTHLWRKPLGPTDTDDEEGGIDNNNIEPEGRDSSPVSEARVTPAKAPSSFRRRV
jgi:hypothetical protein